jgi:hypothetical protein
MDRKMLNSAPRFPEPDDAEPDFTGFEADYVAEDVELTFWLPAGELTLVAREVSVPITGTAHGFTIARPARLVDCNGRSVDVRVGCRTCLGAEYLVSAALDRWVTSRWPAIETWAAEKAL